MTRSMPWTVFAADVTDEDDTAKNEPVAARNESVADADESESGADADEPVPEEDEPAAEMNEAVAAAQAALAGEHACVYGYGVVGAHLSDDAQAAAQQTLNVHEARRETLRGHLKELDATPVAALAAYALPFSVTDAPSARELAGVLEQRLTAVYVDLLSSGADREMLEFAADALTDAAVRAAGWGAEVGAFPGLDGRDGAPVPESED